MKRSLVFLSLVLTASLFAQRRAVQRPSHISSEFPVSGITYARGAMGMRPRIALGEHQALIVWTNGVVRVDELGLPLDSVPLLTGQLPFGPQDVVWTGDEYLVLLTRWTGSNVALSLVRVRTDGHVSAPIDLETPSDPNVAAAIAIRGDELAIVYSTRTPAGTYVAKALLVSRTTFTITQRLDLDQTTTSMSSGRVIASPAGYLLLRPRRYDMITADNGTFGGELPQPDLDAVWNGTEFVVAGADYGGVSVYPLSVNGFPGESRLVHAAFRSLTPAIAWNGTEYRVLWQDEQRVNNSGLIDATYDLLAARLAADRTPIEERTLQQKVWSTDFRFIPGPDGVALITTGTMFIPVWMTGQPSQIPARWVYDGSLGAGELPQDFTPKLVSRAAEVQSVAGLAATPQSARVFWFEGDKGITSTSIDPFGYRGAATNAGMQGRLIAAFNGVDTVAAWTAGTDLRATVIDEAGNVVAQTTVATSPHMSLVAFDCNAHDCAAAWSDNGNMYFQRIAPDGSPLALAAGFAGLSGRGDEYLLVFAWGSNLYATRWADGKLSDVTDLQTGLPGLPLTFASKPDGWLVIAGQTVIRLDANAQIEGRSQLPVNAYTSAAWDGRDWIIAWGAGDDIKAVRMHADGTMDVPFLVAGTLDPETPPIVRSAGNGRTAVAYGRSTNDRIYGPSNRVFVRWIE